eukprot:scaffold1594_cov401-Prasinococcus_capsulatus_cf.AAC.60
MLMLRAEHRQRRAAAPRPLDGAGVGLRRPASLSEGDRGQRGLCAPRPEEVRRACGCTFYQWRLP